jgi:hypothetical protein
MSLMGLFGFGSPLFALTATDHLRAADLNQFFVQVK